MIIVTDRKLNIPRSDLVVGYAGDNLVETRTFELPKIYNGVDLSAFDFKLDTQLGEVKNIIDLVKSVTEDKITLTWTVEESHILHPGRMSIQIRAFSQGEEKWHSALDYVLVQASINATEVQPDPLPSEFTQMELRVTAMKNQAQEAAQTAEQQADRAQGIADTFSNTTLPAAITAVEAAGQAKVDLAEQQAIIATTKAQEASDSAAAALASEQATKTSEDNAAGHAGTATEQADRAQDIADTFENETLPAAITAVEAAGQAKVYLAEQQANIAAGHAQTAATKAEETSGYVNDAFEYKEAAEGAASIATEKAWEAANSAQIAEQQAGIAATKATEAYDSAERAKMSEEAVEGVADEHRLKIAKLEKELNDYKATMQQINVNQEATQQVTGYGIVSLPKNAANGQVSASLKGQTRTNLLGVRGNFLNGIGTWLKQSTTTQQEQEGLKVQLTNVSAGGLYLDDVVVDNTKYYLVILKARKESANSVSLRVYLSGSFDGGVIKESNAITNQNYSIAYMKLSPIDLVGATTLRLYARVTGNPYTSAYMQSVGAYNITEENYNTITDSDVETMYQYIDGTKSTISAMRLRSVSADESEGSTAYVLAKDEDGNIEELRSLPNGTKDEIRVSGGKAELVKRTNKKMLQASNVSRMHRSYTNVDIADIDPNLWADAKQWLPSVDGMTYIEGKTEVAVSNIDNVNSIGNYYTNLNALWFIVPKGTTLEQAREQLAGLELIYQLATPIEKPIQVSGSLVSYPSGTVYIEPFVADAGIYTDKMTVLHQDLPIKVLEKLSKIDFMTGLETELDVSDAVIAEDKLSFTHPDLTSGDIVFFVYEHGAEGTIPETEISYYDSRYVIKDSVTEKFYKWHIAVADGVPSIELVEV